MSTETSREAANEHEYIPAYRGRHVLLVEDAPIYMERLVALLAPLEMHIRCAVNGQLAIEDITVHNHPIDILITDLDLPYYNGWEVIDVLRRHRGDRVPVLMQTGEADYPSVIARARELDVVLIDKEAINFALAPAVETIFGVLRTR